MKKLLYPACFYPCEDKPGAYTVVIPDLPGCVTEGKDLADAIAMATDAASGWVLDELEDGKFAPKPSSIKDVHPDSPDGFVNLLIVDMDAYAEKYGNKAVRKNLTIPAWQDTFCEKHHLRLSEMLQQTISDCYERMQHA